MVHCNDKEKDEKECLVEVAEYQEDDNVPLTLPTILKRIVRESRT